MKSFILTIFMLLIAVACFGKTVTLSWDPSPSEGVTSYTVYQGTTDTGLNIPIVVGDVLTWTIEDLDNRTSHYFGVTASNAIGDESTLSNIVLSPGFAVPEPPSSLGGTTTINNIVIPVK
jgi:hypothetical protein